MPYPRSLGLAVSLVSLLLAACGDDDGPGFTFADSTTPPPSPEGGPGPTPTPTPPGPVPTERVFVGPGAPADAPSMFGGSPAASGGPQIVYPAPGVVVPPNLRELEIHYRPGGHSVFELAITGAFLNLKIYVGCPEEVEGGCIYTPDEEVWDAFAAGSRGGGALEMVLRGTDGRGGPVASSAPQAITVVQEDITGGLYYWNALGGTINRFEFGRRGARAEVFLDQPRTGAGFCVGCHAISRDGSRIAVGLDLPVTTFQSYDVASRTRQFSLGSGGFPMQPTFFAWSTDGAQIVTGGGRGLDIRDGFSGMVTEAAIATNATMPDWSPDGNRIVYVGVETPPPFDTASVSSGQIELLERDGAGWRPGQTLVPRMGDNNFYPAFSPDGQWVIYIRSPSNQSSFGADPETTDGVTDAELWVISLDGTRVMRLAAAGGLADSWPKWDPTIYQSGGQTVFWLSWASRRSFGLRLPENRITQIWMTPFFPNEAIANRDPSPPAFRLPFQSIESGNHVAQWVTRVQRMTCVSDDECGGEFCLDGVCVPDFI